MGNDSSKLKLRLILSLYAIVMIIFARYAYITEAFTWLWDCVITFLIGFFVYKLRNKLRLTPLLFLLLMFALGLHAAGVYGLYTKAFFGLDFDHYTHFFGSFAVCMILVNWLLNKVCNVSKVGKVCKENCSHPTNLTNYKPYKLSFATVCFIAILMTLGISAIHETIEFLGYTLLNADGANLFFPGNVPVNALTDADIGDSGTYFNTMIDIIYNAVGATAGCVVMGIKKLFS